MLREALVITEAQAAMQSSNLRYLPIFLCMHILLMSGQLDPNNNYASNAFGVMAQCSPME